MIMSKKKPGLNLTDLAPMSKDIPVGDSYLTVQGISAKTGLEIIKRFPKILGMVTGEKFDLGAFVTVAPDAVAAIIAAAVGQLGDKEAEERASEIGFEYQMDLLEAVGGMTFTKGFAPFAQRIMTLANAANSDLSSKVPDMKLQQTSRPSSPPVTPQP